MSILSSYYITVMVTLIGEDEIPVEEVGG